MRALSGVTTCLHLLARGLSRFGVEPTIVELERWAGADSRPVVNAGRRPWQTAYGYHRRVIGAINRCRPHVVVCNDQRGWPYLPSLAGKVPVINVAHVDSGRPEFWQQIAEGLPYLRAQVGISDRVAERLRALAPHGPEVVTIPYGIEVPSQPAHRIGPVARPPVLLYVGRLDQRQKRVHDIPEFVRELDRRLPDYRLVIVGDGDEREALEAALAFAGPRVTFTGSVDRGQVLKHYQKAHYLLLFSNFEGLPLALLEGMAYGVVPVVTDIPSGVRQVLRDGDNGYLFPVGAPSAAARLVAEACPVWDRVSGAAWESVRAGFGAEVMCRRYAELFHRVAQRPPTTPLRYVDAYYPGWPGRIARRVLPIPIYCGLLGRAL
jgi:glycosyltransferase involved in cell wall biosynthesis